jgi:hypothetical protein
LLSIVGQLLELNIQIKHINKRGFAPRQSKKAAHLKLKKKLYCCVLKVLLEGLVMIMYESKHVAI